MKINQEIFGKMPTGEQVDVYTLTNDKGVSVKVLNLGGIIFELNLPDRHDRFENVSANLETVEEYLTISPHFGTLIGRVTNRIAGARFSVDGQTYQLVPNSGKHLLHGGINGFNKILWNVETWEGNDFVGLKLSLVSDEKSQGFPGTVECLVTYKLSNSNEFEIDYRATADKATPVNLTNHCYFSLNGFNRPTVYDEEVTINADRYLLTDEDLIPTGEIASVEGTPFDFRKPVKIGTWIEHVGDDPNGYDLCYVLNQENPGELTLCARVSDPESGRTLELWTDVPGVQFYTGNFLKGNLKACGHTYEKHAAFCLETQHFPDAPNHPTFPDTILRPGETYKHTALFKFGVTK